LNDTTRNAVADALEHLANQQEWNSEAWQRCYELVAGNWESELLEYVHDDLIHYDGVFHSRNILGFRVKPDSDQLEQYRQEFRSIAAAVRANLSLTEAKEKYDL